MCRWIQQEQGQSSLGSSFTSYSSRDPEKSQLPVVIWKSPSIHFTLPLAIMDMEKWSLQNWFPFILGSFLLDHFPQVGVKINHDWEKARSLSRLPFLRCLGFFRVPSCWELAAQHSRQPAGREIFFASRFAGQKKFIQTEMPKQCKRWKLRKSQKKKNKSSEKKSYKKVLFHPGIGHLGGVCCFQLGDSYS